MARGRPKKFDSVSEMQKKIDEYFESRDKAGLGYTITGLALGLGMTRETLLQYEKNSEFSDAIKKAKTKIEESLEQRLLDGKNVVGVIFNLKNNFGWKDQQQVEHSGAVDIVTMLKKAQGRVESGKA